MATTPKAFYEAANLKDNPFRSNPTLESDPRMNIWVGYEKERQQLYKYIERSRADQIGNANLLLLYGDLGTGKSHALFWAKYQILEAKRAEFNSVAYYIQTLRKDAGKISFAAAFREDIVGKSSLISDVLKCKQFYEECVIDYKRDNGLGIETSKEVVLEKLLNSMEMFNFAKEILRCEFEDDVRTLLLSAKSDYQAMTTFTKLVNLFVFEIVLKGGGKRFKNGAYLFIDELDLLATSTAKEARDTNELLRHIYDNCPVCFCMVLGFTATAAEINILFSPFVLSRVSRMISINLLQVEEAKTFVRDILDSNRIDSAKAAGYFPFEEQAIQGVVSQIVAITPRKVINTMQQIIEEIRLLGYDLSKGPVSQAYLDDNDIIVDLVSG